MDSTFNYVVAGLESKEFGNEKFYFDNHGCVVAIRHGENISVTVYDKKGDCMLLVTETGKGYSINIPIDMGRLFVIPEIVKRTDVKFIQKCRIDDHHESMEKEMSKSIFLIANYGLIENPIFKGGNVSRSKINVAVLNFQREVFSISFEVGDGVRGGNENVNGNIPNTYTMNPIGIMYNNVVVIDI